MPVPEIGPCENRQEFSGSLTISFPLLSACFQTIAIEIEY